MPQKVLGIDVGTYSVKVAEINQTFKTFELGRFFEKVVVYNEVLSPDEARAGTLQKLIEEENLSADLILTVLPGQYCVTRVIQFPFSGTKKIDTAVEFEIEAYVPFQLGDMVIDYHVLESDKQSSKVLISYAKKTDLIDFLSLFSNLPFEPSFVGCESIELGNLLKLGLSKSEGVYAILNVGHTKSEMAIFDGASLKWTRTLLIGGKQITEKIAEKMGVPFDEAEKMKKELSHLSEETDSLDEMTLQVTDAVRGVIDELVVEIKQTFAAFQENMGGGTVQALYLCGGSARLGGMDHRLSVKLRKNVSLLDPFDDSFNRLSDGNACRSIIPTSLAVAARSALRGKLPDIQFRRGEFAYRGDLKGLNRLFKEVGILAACLLTFAVINFMVSYSLMKSRVVDLRRDVAAVVRKAIPDASDESIGKPQQALAAVNRQVMDLRDKKKKISEMAELKVLDLLLEIATKSPEKSAITLDVDSLTFASNHIVLKGETGSFQAVDQLKAALTQSDLFSQISTDNIQKGRGDSVKFNMTLEIKSPEGKGHGA